MNTLIIFGLLAFYQIGLISSEQNVPAIIDIGQNDATASNPNETVNDVLKFGTNIINTLTEKINTLPPNMRPAGQNILADAREGLQSCESAFVRDGTAWEYKVCCSAYLKSGMTAFGNLAADSYRSKAERPFLHSTTLFLISSFFIFVLSK